MCGSICAKGERLVSSLPVFVCLLNLIFSNFPTRFFVYAYIHRLARATSATSAGVDVQKVSVLVSSLPGSVCLLNLIFSNFPTRFVLKARCEGNICYEFHVF